MSPTPHLPGFWFHALDPHLATAELWEHVRQPVLGLWGELDCQVPAHESLAAVRTALERGPNTAYDLQVLPAADHGLAPGRTVRTGDRCFARRALPLRRWFPVCAAEWVHSLESGREDRAVLIPPLRTPSPLGWHQSTETAAPWFGSMAAQLAVLPVLLLLFGSVGLIGPARRTVGVARRRPPSGLRSGRWWRLAGLAGFVATLLGTLALVELLMLADLRSAPLLGGPSVGGTSPLFAAAGVLAAATLMLGAVALVTEIRAGSVRRLRMGLTAAGVLQLGAWIYWGFIPLPTVG